MTRILLACILALGLSTVPLATVRACSCAMPGAPEDIAATSELAFVGTVVDAGPGVETMLGRTVAYAFDVERASVDAPAELVVHAVEEGSACGFVFAVGERWFVSASTLDGTLSTGLCSGNVRSDEMAEGQLERVLELLPVVPPPVAKADDATASGPPAWMPFAIAGLGVIALVGVMIVAFRREPRDRAS